LSADTLRRGRVLVVGAGLAGLAAARELAGRAAVTVVERLPAIGGTWGFEHPQVRELAGACQRSGVDLLPGVTALRWRAGRLLISGPGQTRWLPADHLVFAGGSRPAHAAELGVTGSRPAGVFSATVAHHLLDAGIVLGRRCVVTGWGDWAELVVPHLRPRSGVTIVGGAGADMLPWPEVSWWPDYRPVSIHGGARVERITISDGRTDRTLRCDCVILAGQPRALRNVDGANRDGAEGVTFIQPTAAGLGPDGVADYGRSAAASITFERPAERKDST
jgi:NADPH-dependent 2,4-dienoyl-CoA reductase/sulfur reductase-like enzyme